MKCHEATALQLFTDDELDAVGCAAFLAHLDGCAVCAGEHVALCDLRTRVQSQATCYAMPARLRQRLDAIVAQGAGSDAGTRPSRARGSPGRRQPDRRWLWAGMGAVAGGALALAATILVVGAGTWMSNRGLVDAVVAAHGRASLAGHVVDVDSSDHHTVRPWLSQRLDYSPPVVDLKDQGFPLLGGRLDRIDDMSVATLVYRAGRHRIDVFVRPLPTTLQGFEPTSVRGYNIVESRGLGMEWIGVSDINPTQLHRLVDLLAHPPPNADAAEPSVSQ